MYGMLQSIPYRTRLNTSAGKNAEGKLAPVRGYGGHSRHILKVAATSQLL